MAGAASRRDRTIDQPTPPPEARGHTAALASRPLDRATGSTRPGNPQQSTRGHSHSVAKRGHVGVGRLGWNGVKVCLEELPALHPPGPGATRHAPQARGVEKPPRVRTWHARANATGTATSHRASILVWGCWNQKGQGSGGRARQCAVAGTAGFPPRGEQRHNRRSAPSPDAERRSATSGFRQSGAATRR